MNPSDEIKQKLDIVDFIREYIPVKAVGANFQALCPFHGEKTPSLVISPEKQIWHCFGCGKGGDVFSFLMEIEGLTFLEAVRELAPRVGVVLRNDNPENHSKRNRLLDIMALSVKYYNHVLKTSVGEKPLVYLTKRGLTPEVIEDWQIGYSPDSWDSLMKLLSARPLDDKKYLPQEMLEAGLVVKKEGAGSRFYDRFRDRIMFPVCDVNGNPIAYSARINPEVVNDKVGKYINSPQGPIYDKSRVLFGLDKAKNYIKSKDLAIVVEGQMDVIACHQFGHKNAVASSGTALTSEQVALLKRYTNNIALCFDADAAGQLAADRGIKEAMAAEMNIRVIIIPNGKDPDDALRQDPNSFELAVKEAKPMMEYYFDKITAGLDLTAVENKKEVAKKMLAMIAKLANKIEAAYWLKITAQALETDENALRESLPKESVREVIVPVKTPQVASKSREEQLSELLLAIIIRFPDFVSYVISKLELDWLENETNRSFYKQLIIYYNKNNALDYSGFRESLVTGTSEAADILDRLILLGEKDFYSYEAKNIQEELIKVIIELKKYYLQKQIAMAQKAMAEAEKSGNVDEINKILERLKSLTDSQRNNQVS